MASCFTVGHLIGGIFFGAVTDFGALYASVKNDGKSMGLLIEKYIGKFGTKIILACSVGCSHFLLSQHLQIWLQVHSMRIQKSTELVKLADAAKTNGAAGTISLLFIAFAMVFGLVQKKFQFRGWKETVVGLVFTVAALALGMLSTDHSRQKILGLISHLYISSLQQYFRCGF